jgi:hypothetical protein
VACGTASVHTGAKSVVYHFDLHAVGYSPIAQQVVRRMARPVHLTLHCSKKGKAAMPRLFTASSLLVLLLFTLVGTPIHSRQEKRTTPAKPPELTPRRSECAILLPERDERHDFARLVRAEQFLSCERDGYPKNLAPPWKTSEEGTKKLGDACEYFAGESAREYSQVGQASLKLAADRCRANVMDVIMMQLVRGLGGQPKQP